MSDNLPLEIQVEIMQRVPVKSLIQFRSVSKAWKSLIDSSDFVAHYSRGYHTQTQMQHILVRYEPAHYHKPNYLSIADDYTFPQNRVFLTVPLLVNMLTDSRIIGCSHGLLCLRGFYSKTLKNMAVLWNPLIERAIPVLVPNLVYGKYETVFGFGVCGVKTDPKIVKITCIKSESDIKSISCIPWQVEVFTLSIGAWRSPYSNLHLPRKSIRFHRSDVGVAVDGVLYWLATDRITMDGGFGYYNLIVSFDVTSEEFREVNLPHSLAHTAVCNVSMSKQRESLIVLHHGVEANNPVIDVWKMEDGVPKAFTKLFTINVNTPDASVNTLDGAEVKGFRKSGEPIIKVIKNGLPAFDLGVYDPYSKQVDYLGFSGIAYGLSVHPYMETLLLLDQPNYAAYNVRETIRFLDDLVLQVT